MSMHPDWPRWIFSSICKHFDVHKGDLTLIIEGQELPSNEVANKAELRIDGPHGTELSRNYWYLYLEVNILLTSIIDNVDIHRIHKSAGTIASAFEGMIPVYKYGDGLQDDDTFLGCLTLIQVKGSSPLRINHYGQPDPALKLLHASVEGHYFIHLES